MKIIIELFRGGVSAVYYDLEAKAKASDALPTVCVVHLDGWFKGTAETHVQGLELEPLQDARDEVREAVALRKWVP
jgi:hypothetical protein